MTGRSFVGLVALLAALAVPSTVSAGTADSERYIVVLEDSVASAGEVARDHRGAHGIGLGFVYEHALKGYAAQMSDEAASRIARDPRVSFVEVDRQIEALAQTVPTGVRRIFATANGKIDIDGADDLRVDVDTAVIDTGIDFDHPDLNVVHRADCTSLLGCVSGSGDDLNGHGTHVAGSIGAIDNGSGVVGVAPGARLWAIKVLGDAGTGLTSWVIAGVDYVTARADRIEVANMSLGGGSSSSLCRAVEGSISGGVVYAVAAGNEDQNAKDTSPANCSGVITTSALADFDGVPGALGSATCRSDEDDTLANFSNWGSTVEIAAPGVCILSTWAGGGYRTASGTSMASPHAAGAASILASGANDPKNGADVTKIANTITSEGNFNWTDDSGDGTKEPLLAVGDATVFAPAMVAGSDPGTTPQDNPPTASITNPADGSTVSDTVTVRVQAGDTEDGQGTLDVDVSIDGGAWRQSSYNSSTDRYELSWDTTTVSDGSHTIDARATDSAGNTMNAGRVSVTVDNQPVSDPWGLTVSGSKAKGTKRADLSWNTSATSASQVDVWRDGSLITTTANDGAHTDVIGKGGGSHTYKVCEAGGTSNCSAEATVTF